MNSIHAVILTLDEEQHIRRCIESLGGQCASVTLIDCGSKDRTAEIANSLGANVIFNPWINYSTQMNFGIDAVADRRGWLLRIDADEVLDTDSCKSLKEAVESAPADAAGLLVQRRIHFLGRRIKHGSIEPSWQLRLWRNGSGRCEKRWMDEHIQVAGRVVKSGVVLTDINLNSLTWWTAKHNNYASREAIDILNLRHRLLPTEVCVADQASSQARRRRFVKERIYCRLSPGARALLYFLYRYLLRLGFLDGREGFYFHVLHSLWYRTLVDGKIMEIQQTAKTKGVSVIDAIRDRTGIDPIPTKVSTEVRPPQPALD